MKLTDQACKNAKPREKTYKLTDGGGLYLEVTPLGSKLWRLKYRYLGKEKKLSIGPYPLRSLAEARDHRDQAKKLLLDGHDPAEAKKETKRQKIVELNNTFEVIAREWHSLKKPEWSETNAATVLTRLEKDVFPIIGHLPIKKIEHETLLNLARSIKDRGAHELAKRIIQISAHIFQYAIITKRADKNIATDLRGLIKSAPKGHFAAIEANEIPKFLADLHAHEMQLNRQTFLALKLMMLTFVRTGELIKAPWSEIDLEQKTWIIPAKRMKMKTDHIVPLSTQAVEILKSLRQIHTNPHYVFPHRSIYNSHMSNGTILMALDRMGYRGKMTGHGFRALAMSTLMEKLGYRQEVPDLQLSHTKRGDVARAYDRAKFLDERTEMMQRWADYLDNIRQGGTISIGKFGETA